jgi:hypothetical protein
MAICPAGHDSASDDFCEVCGVLIAAQPSLGLAQPSLAQPSLGLAPTVQAPGLPAPVPAESCPECGATRAGQFCESCGHDFAGPAASAPAPVPAPPASVPLPSAPVPLPPPPLSPSTWAAVVTADRGYYEGVLAASGAVAADIPFPAYCPERRFPLDGSEVRVGRRSVTRGLEPEIDLTGPPADPGISRLHVVLLRAPDGSWSAVDPGSENGTLLNGAEIPPNRPVKLRDGDRLHLGAWTQLTIAAVPARPGDAATGQS